MSQCHSSSKIALLSSYLVAALACGLGGCGGLESGDAPAIEPATTGALTSCFEISPNDVLDQAVDRSHSPTTYGRAGCTKAWVVDVVTMDLSTGFVEWTDPWARSRSQCVGGKLRVQLLTKAPAEPRFLDFGTYEAPMVWDASQSRCRYGAIGVAPLDGTKTSWTLSRYLDTAPFRYTRTSIEPIPSLQGRTVRFVASALSPAGNTQPLSVYANSF